MNYLLIEESTAGSSSFHQFTMTDSIGVNIKGSKEEKGDQEEEREVEVEEEKKMKKKCGGRSVSQWIVSSTESFFYW